VTPGLIDLHIHCFDGVSTGVNADHYSLGRGVTTVVDAGSTGYPMIGTFVKYIIEPSITRIYALVEIGPLGTMLIGVSRYMYDLDWGVNPQLTAQAAEENKPAVVGNQSPPEQRSLQPPGGVGVGDFEKSARGGRGFSSSANGSHHQRLHALAGGA